MLRAEKLCLATYLEDEYNELWHPVKGRNLCGILKNMHFDPMDDPAFNIIPWLWNRLTPACKAFCPTDPLKLATADEDRDFKFH